MNILVWQWGRRGAGPRFAAALSRSLADVEGVRTFLSLSTGAEILRSADPPANDLPMHTYDGVGGFALRLAGAPVSVGPLALRIAKLGPDLAICAMPGPLDLLAAAALGRLGLPFVVVVHDADAHPGDGLPFQMTLQRRLIRGANGVIALSGHVASQLREQGAVAYPGEAGLEHRPLLRARHPPFVFGPAPPPPRAHGGPFRLLSFGRLLPYKGLDLLADALERLGPDAGIETRVVGQGPDSATLIRLARLPGVTVENRWVPEDEIGGLLAWSDAIVLSHREASQSGVAAAAIAAGRWVVATRVGGLSEQLRGQPLATLCDPAPESLAAGIASLLSEPAPDADADPAAEWRVVARELVAQLRGVRRT